MAMSDKIEISDPKYSVGDKVWIGNKVFKIAEIHYKSESRDFEIGTYYVCEETGGREFNLKADLIDRLSSEDSEHNGGDGDE